MIPLRDVVDDIIKHGVRNFDCDFNLRHECEKSLEKAYSSAGADEMKAKAVLDAMREHIPKCVSNSKIIKRIVWGDKTPSGTQKATIQPQIKENK